VWLRVYDADNKTLKIGTLKQGEQYEVPADANGPMLNVGRPDKLTVTLNGNAIPPLGDGSRAIKDVKLDPASIAARASGAPLANAPSPRETSAPRRTQRSAATAQTAPAPAPSPSPATTAPADL